MTPFPSWTWMWVRTTTALAPRPQTRTTQRRCRFLVKMLLTILLRATMLRHDTQPGAVKGSGNNPAARQRGREGARSAAATLRKHSRASVSAWQRPRPWVRSSGHEQDKPLAGCGRHLLSQQRAPATHVIGTLTPPCCLVSFSSYQSLLVCLHPPQHLVLILLMGSAFLFFLPKLLQVSLLTHKPCRYLRRKEKNHEGHCLR